MPTAQNLNVTLQITQKDHLTCLKVYGMGRTVATDIRADMPITELIESLQALAAKCAVMNEEHVSVIKRHNATAAERQVVVDQIVADNDAMADARNGKLDILAIAEEAEPVVAEEVAVSA